ncbi:MAG TPA: SLBB domain-containing protein, partial [Verrucomicrobiae bacterium]|nr:SLBB domain-containing protein [Verrucomicrobiae bacterium]
LAYNSKHYYLLGAVTGKGAYTLDRPLTIIEAVGRAGGLETGMYERNTVELADLSHSFLVRNNERVPVDFEKLFQNGDLSQNIALEPDDYLYFASANANQIYLLGELASPGPQIYSPHTTIIAAITGHGGFLPKAYKSRVLVVRGSLNKPDKVIVNVADILAGRSKDFLLEPGDIVYVSPRPWAKAEDLLDNATMAFIQAALVTYTGSRVGPFITHPVLP